MTTGALPALRDEDYAAIEAAVVETARGRWFLREYARRNRYTDTQAVLATLDRLERVIRRDHPTPDVDRIRLDLADMAQAIERTKVEIAELGQESDSGGRFARATLELDAIVGDTERATNQILAAAEQVQEMSWTVREAGGDAALCDALDERATEIYTACSFQDLTGQRTRKVVRALGYLDERIRAMSAIWAADGMPVPNPREPEREVEAGFLSGPALAGEGNDQAAIDVIVHDLEFGEASPLEDPADHQVLDLAEDGDELDFVVASYEEVDTAAPLPADGDEPPSSIEPPGIRPGAAATAPRHVPEAWPDHAMPRSIGATALAVAAEPAPALLASPALALVPLEDPLARFDAATRLLVFG